jgi:hypothetical protein
VTPALKTLKMSVKDTSGIVNDDSRLMLQIVASLTDNSRVIIYNRNMFIVQDAGDKLICSLLLNIIFP